MRNIPNKSEPVVLTSTDHTFAMQVQAIYVGTAGNVVARLRGDSADTTWKASAGQYLYGDWTRVDQTSTAADMLGVQIEEGARGAIA